MPAANVKPAIYTNRKTGYGTIGDKTERTGRVQSKYGLTKNILKVSFIPWLTRAACTEIFKIIATVRSAPNTALAPS